MDPESPPLEADSRFTVLHDESLKLLDAARSLVNEMRTALEDCLRHRPVVDVQEPANGGQAPRPAVRSHRGGRVGSKRRHRRNRRPR